MDQESRNYSKLVILETEVAQLRAKNAHMEKYLKSIKESADKRAEQSLEANMWSFASSIGTLAHIGLND